MTDETMWPRVAVIILNYNGRRFLSMCLQAVAATDYPADALEIIVVDNASQDDSVARLHENFPHVRVLALQRNLGFAGGNNAGIRATDAPYVVLLNNDTAVDPGWLKPLVRAAEADPKIGGCGSKLVFFYEMLPVTLEIEGSFVPAQVIAGNGDGRVLGVRLAEATISCSDHAPVGYAEGWYEQEQAGEASYRWSRDRAVLELPVADRHAPFDLLLQFAGGPPAPLPPARVSIKIGDDVLHTVEVGADPVVLTAPISVQHLAHAQRYIQNAGQELLPGGYIRDRGSWSEKGVERHAQDGAYERQEAVFGLCGAAMLLRRAMLEQIGLLDDRFFMYYEDVDLCWRARAAGWQLVYVPSSVVRHIHSGSSGAWSAFFRFHVERNRLLMLIKNAPPRLAWQSTSEYMRDTGRWMGRSVAALRQGLASARRSLFFVQNNLRVLASLVLLLPHMLRQRITIRRHAVVDDAAIMGWMIKEASAAEHG